MQEATSSFLQLEAKKTAGQISAYAKATLLCGPTASTASAIVIPDSSELEAGSEKWRGNLFILEKYGRYVHYQECISRRHKKTTFMLHCLKQKCILGLGCKEKKKNWCAAGSKKVGKLTSPLGTWQLGTGTIGFISEHVHSLNSFAAAHLDRYY